LAAPAVPYSSPSVFTVPGNQLTPQQLYPGLPAANQPPAILGTIQPAQLVPVPQLRPGTTGSGVMTSSGGGGAAMQPMVYWYPPAGQVSPAGNSQRINRYYNIMLLLPSVL